jgi:hypothetical protein
LLEKTKMRGHRNAHAHVHAVQAHNT